MAYMNVEEIEAALEALATSHPGRDGTHPPAE